MARFIALTTDIPYFPGKNGHDFFNLRFLALQNEVVVVAPIYGGTPAEGIRNLEDAVTRVIAWPRPVSPVALFIDSDQSLILGKWSEMLPRPLRRWALESLMSLRGAPPDALARLAILSNLAPYLLQALQEGTCQAIILIQSNLAPYFKYLPGPAARLVYFHDVRSTYLENMRRLTGDSISSRDVVAVRRQESEACRSSDAVGFVSDLDKARADKLFGPSGKAFVAPIPLDTDYFKPAPASWRRESEPSVLFTGHLGHPPNVDAVRFFALKIWPGVLARIPTARFVVAGLHPAKEIEQLAEEVPRFELHPNVPDIRPFFWNASVYVVPMRFGGGVRQKILEAWSMEVPVVCTTMAAEGIMARSGGNCWLEDEPGHFASRLCEILAGFDTSAQRIAAKLQIQETNSIPAAAPKFSDFAKAAVRSKAERPYRVLYDLRWMTIGSAGGTEQMTHELISAISRTDNRNEYRIYCPRSTYFEWQFPPGFKVRGIPSDPEQKAVEIFRSAASNSLADQLGLPAVLTPPLRNLRALCDLDCDLVHSMVSYVHPDLDVFPHVLTVHDLQHIHYPHFFGDAAWKERDNLYRRSVERAKHIICISEFTRRDVHERYGVPLDKMTTIWNIPNPRFSRPLSEATRSALIRKMGVKGRFVFFPGHCWPHKNHARLVEAFARATGAIPKDFVLVFSGQEFPADHPARALIEEKGLSQRVLHLGYRSPIELQALHESCHLLAFPSLFEGFGLPVAEAVMAGRPVACSNRTSLPEIAGDAAVTFDPEDADDIARSLLAVINDPSRHSALVAAAKQRRSLFSARLCAIRTLGVYRKVYNQIYN